MQTYYFDMKDGVPVRDRAGLEFRTDSQAIMHCKKLARRFSHERLIRDDNLFVVVINESGAEIHREPVYPDTHRAASAGRPMV